MKMKPWEHQIPPVLYKYLHPERLHVLNDCRIRFSQRAVFDDDHELQPDYAIFGTASEIWRYALSIGFSAKERRTIRCGHGGSHGAKPKSTKNRYREFAEKYPGP